VSHQRTFVAQDIVYVSYVSYLYFMCCPSGDVINKQIVIALEGVVVLFVKVDSQSDSDRYAAMPSS